MNGITRVEKLNKNSYQPIEEVITEYIARLEDEIVVDIKFYAYQHEVLPSTAYLFIAKEK